LSRYLIDTNVISEFTKPLPNVKAVRWVRAQDVSDLFVSVITIGEIRTGIEDMAAGRRRAELEAWIETGLPAWFRSNMLPVTRQIAELWGQLTIQVKRQGRLLTTSDGLIAATAIANDLTLVTRNEKDLLDLG
jgi:predicted nucleic acid-binding protein